jgi:thiamine kinase-like enzyme
MTDSISLPQIEVIDEETDTHTDTHIDTLLAEPVSSSKPKSDEDTAYADLLTKLSKMPPEEQQKFIANMQLLQQNAQKPKPETVLPKPKPAPKPVAPVASSPTREELLAKLHNRTSTLSLKRKPKKIVKEMATKMAAEPNNSQDGSEMPNMAQLQEMMKKMNMKNMPAMKDIEKMMKMLKKDGLN